MIYDETHAARLKDIKVLGNRFNSIVNVNNAGAHNSLYRGKNLGTAITAQQLSAIRNGSYADLYPGDYWNLPIDGTTIARIMHLNYWKEVNWAVPTTQFHIYTAIVLLSNTNWKYTINDIATTEGGLAGSKMWTEHLPEIYEKVKAVIGEENICDFWRQAICDSVDSITGLCNHRIEVTSPIWLPTAAQVLPYRNNNMFNTIGNSYWGDHMWAAKSHLAYSFGHGTGLYLDNPASLTTWYAAYWQMGLTLTTPANVRVPINGAPIYTCPYIILK